MVYNGRAWDSFSERKAPLLSPGLVLAGSVWTVLGSGELAGSGTLLSTKEKLGRQTHMATVINT